MNNIYIIKTDDTNNISIGQTTQNVADYIKHSYRKSKTETLFVENDFPETDKAIHAKLKELGYKQSSDYNGTETFDFGNANAVDIVKAIIVSLKTNTPLDLQRTQDFKPRKEQQDAINKAVAYFNEKGSEFLWNCKMRFGKTFSTYKLIEKQDYKNVLIITYKPVVKDSWKTDLLSHIDFKGWRFVENESDYKTGQWNICFASCQKLLVGEKTEITINDIVLYLKQNVGWIFTREWDLLVADEVHYGTRSELGQGLKDNLQYKKLLELSGTPYKIMENGEYSEENSYSWNYNDEQKAKKNWDDAKGDNPYEFLPDLKQYQYTGLSDLMECNKNEFDINKFFETNETGGFIYESQVQRLIDFMCGEAFDLDENKRFLEKECNIVLPYLNVGKNKMRDKNRNSIWFFKGIKQCNAMAELLQRHKIFKDYKVIIATGDGEGSAEESLQAIKNAIAKGKNTICLSCGMLTEGITIPELNSVIMLRKNGSPQTYWQALFRCQSPWKAGNKRECWTFDFDPYTCFQNIESLTKNSSKTYQAKQKDAEEILHGISLWKDGVMKELNYQDYLEYLSLDFSAKEVQKRVKRINNLSADLLSQLNPEILSIIDSLPLFRTSKQEKEDIAETTKPTDDVEKEESTESKQAKKAKQQAVKQKKKETNYELRWQKLNCFISSLLEFMYISNYAEENISDFINCKYPDLFKRICVISLDSFNKLLDNKVFRDEVLNKTIRTFKHYESNSRDVGKIVGVI
jgi:superfamily II DNA or RNA helicase